MAVTQTYTIDLVNHATPVVVPVSQYDVGRVIKFNIRNNGTTYDVSSYSAILQGKFGNGKSFKITGSVSGSTVSFTCTKESTAFCGRVMAEVRIAKGSETVGTMNFVWEVEETPDTTHPVTQSDIAIYQQLVAQAQAAAAQAQTYANQAKSSSESANKLQKRTYVMIGDSYGAGQNMSDSSKNWQAMLKTYLALDPSYATAYSRAISASGFVGREGVETFQQQLTNIANARTADERNAVTDIVVIGGWNDGDCSSSAFGTAISNFDAEARNKFPNAKIWIGYVGWTDRSKYTGDQSNLIASAGIGQYTQWAGVTGWAYMANMEYVMHVYSGYTNDGLHPNEYGQRRIAKYAASVLLGGGIDVVANYDNTFTLDSNVKFVEKLSSEEDPVLRTFINNDVCSLWMRTNRGFDFSSPISLGSGNYSNNVWHTLLTLGDDRCLQGGTQSCCTWHMECIITSNGKWIPVDVTFMLSQNKLQFCVTDAVKEGASEWQAYTNVTRLYTPGGVIYSGPIMSRFA